MSSKSPSSDEGWSNIARELSELPGWEIVTREPSEKPGWEKITYTNGIIYERPIPPKQLELFNFRQTENDANSELVEVVSDAKIEINPELLRPEETAPPPGNVNEYCPGSRNTPYYR